MLLCPVVILDRKLWTVVQTAEAHYTPVLDPDRALILYFDRLHGTFFCAQSAADTAVLHVKM